MLGACSNLLRNFCWEVALLKLICVISVNGLLRLSRLWLTINTHQNKLVQFLPSSAPASLYIYGVFKLNCVVYIICKRLTSISSDNRTLFIGLPQTNVIVNFIGKCFNTKQKLCTKSLGTLLSESCLQSITFPDD